MEKVKSKLKNYINFNYIFQNIKQSKGIFLLIIIIFPLLNLLININGNQTDIGEILTSIFSVGGILRFIIPMVISLELFDYVFKRKKVDLIASMPINKKTIFISNTVAGILMLMLLNMLILTTTILPAVFNTETTIIVERIIDNVLLLFLSQLVIFTLTNIAIALTGKVRGVLVLLIVFIFMIPIYLNIFQLVFLQKNYLMVDGISYSVEGEKDILPNPLGIYNMFSTRLNWGIGIKNIIYIIGFIILGTFLFKRKKLEYSEELFKNDIIHELVKGLIFLLPLATFFGSFEISEWELTAFLTLMVITIGLFILYDLVTGKKVEKSVTIISLAVLIAISALVGNTFHEIDISSEKSISRSDIKEVGVDVIVMPYYSSYSDIPMEYYDDDYYYYRHRRTIFSVIDNMSDSFDKSEYIFTKDKEIQEKLLNILERGPESKNKSNNNNSNKNKNSTKYYSTNYYLEEEETDNYNIEVAIKTKGGTYAVKSFIIDKKQYKEIINLFSEKDIKKNLSNRFKSSREYVSYNGESYYDPHNLTTKEISEEVKTKIKDAINTMDLEELNSMLSRRIYYRIHNDSDYYLLETYKNGVTRTYYVLKESVR